MFNIELYLGQELQLLLRVIEIWSCQAMIYTKEQICVALLVELHSGLQMPVSQSQKCNIFYYFQ